MKTVYIIKQESHPLKPTSFVYRAYLEDGTPLYIGREKLGELIDYMYQMHPDYVFRIEDQTHMNNNDSTAIPYYIYNRDSKEWWIWKLEGVCTCYTAQINTAGTIFCPCHGLMRKSNGVVIPVNTILKGE